jgi:acyl-CoA synthetase (AMP-forming)/AMP-acid ligase II
VELNGATARTIVDVVRCRAQVHPERRAYTFLRDGEVEETHLSYGELDRQARAIGALLQSYRAKSERVLLIYPPGLDFIGAFLGCLYAGAVAVPVPTRGSHHFAAMAARFRAIVADADPTVALTTAANVTVLRERFAAVHELSKLRWLATDNATSILADEWWDPNGAPDTLAYLQYTSGSTADPKGVMISHANLMVGERMIQQAFQSTSQSIIVGWLPPYHDMGLAGNILQTLYAGARCVLMSPVSFLQKPYRWLQAISRYRATTSGGPNFAYDLCRRRISSEEAATLDLRCWSVAFNGAEPVHQSTIEEFTLSFGPCGFAANAFCPCYGLAEATLLVTGGRRFAPGVTERGERQKSYRPNWRPAPDIGGRPVVGCGPSWLDERIVIADPDSLTACPPNQIGEILVCGPNVAQGYWNRPVDSARTFQAYLRDTGDGPFLRTGDLGFVSDGELFITGRIKDVIIIRGTNYYPQEIERTVQQSHPSIRPDACAAFSIDVAGQEQLVVIAEVQRRPSWALRGKDPTTDSPHTLDPEEFEAMVGHIRREVSAFHGLHVFAVSLLQCGTIPRTTSGKVRRHVCRERFLGNTLNIVGGVTDAPSKYAR